MTIDAIRTPDLIHNLKTHPGGHRKLKRFDPRIKALWTLLVNHAGDDYTLTVNITEYAGLLNVRRRTVQRWLDFFERHHLIQRSQRRGGRGAGVVVRVVWLQRGEDLASRRKRAIQHSKTDHVKPQQINVSGETVTQGHKTLHPTDDLKTNRARVMATLRTVLTANIERVTVAHEATQAFGRWLWQDKPSYDQANAVLQALKATERISTPKWIKSAQDVHRWVRSLIRKLLRWGAAWWGRLQRSVGRKRLNSTLTMIKQALDNAKPCPVCGNLHDQADWSEGRNADGQLNCAGWARVKLDKLIEAHHVEVKEPRRERPVLSVDEKWAEWCEEQQRQRALKEKRTKEAQEILVLHKSAS